ncbi:hypothetical protein ACFE04_014644 [Oxalis oulophora]
MVIRILVIILFVLGLLGSSRASNVPAVFIFGDSLVDVGNNFYLLTSARPVYPNGIDFGNGDHHPSGRYTNNRTGFVINMNQQIRNFENTTKQIISMIGVSAAQNLLRESLYVVVIGSNDILWDPLPEFDIPAQTVYVETLISTFTNQLNRLYSLNARKIVVTNCPKIGCIPYEKDAHPLVGEGCYTPANDLAQLYNSQLKVILPELTENLSGSTYVYADIYMAIQTIVDNYVSYGFEYPDSACCHLLGVHGALIPCITISKVCPNRSEYVFWDAYHPTEATNLIVANYFMDGGSNFISPINIRQLLNS